MNIKEVAELLGVSERAVARYRAAGKLTVDYDDKPGGGRIGIYDQAQVEQLKREMQNPGESPKGKAGPDALTRSRSDGGRASGREPDPEMLERLAALIAKGVGEALAAHLAPALPPAPEVDEGASRGRKGVAVPLAQKLILSLREAARLSGLSYDRLLAACAAKKLKAQRDTLGRGWRVKREDLEAYIRKL